MTDLDPTTWLPRASLGAALEHANAVVAGSFATIARSAACADTPTQISASAITSATSPSGRVREKRAIIAYRHTAASARGLASIFGCPRLGQVVRLVT